MLQGILAEATGRYGRAEEGQHGGIQWNGVRPCSRLFQMTKGFIGFILSSPPDVGANRRTLCQFPVGKLNGAAQIDGGQRGGPSFPVRSSH